MCAFGAGEPGSNADARLRACLAAFATGFSMPGGAIVSAQHGRALRLTTLFERYATKVAKATLFLMPI